MNIPCEALQVMDNQSEIEEFIGKKIDKYTPTKKNHYFSANIGCLGQSQCLFPHEWVIKYQKIWRVFALG